MSRWRTTTAHSSRVAEARANRIGMVLQLCLFGVFGAETEPRLPPLGLCVCPHSQAGARQRATNYRNQSAYHHQQLNPAATVCSVVNTTDTECKEEREALEPTPEQPSPCTRGWAGQEPHRMTEMNTRSTSKQNGGGEGKAELVRRCFREPPVTAHRDAPGSTGSTRSVVPSSSQNYPRTIQQDTPTAWAPKYSIQTFTGVE